MNQCQCSDLHDVNDFVICHANAIQCFDDSVPLAGVLCDGVWRVGASARVLCV